MLESMILSRVPTRAEASDVATAIYDGADAVMLSAETAVGVDCVNAVATMRDIANMTENDDSGLYQQLVHSNQSQKDMHGCVERTHTSDAVSVGAVSLGRAISAGALVVCSINGGTALRLARLRPDRPVVVLTNSKRTARMLTLVWGVSVHVYKGEIETWDHMVATTETAVCGSGIVAPGETVVIVAKAPFVPPGGVGKRRGGCNAVFVQRMAGSAAMSTVSSGAVTPSFPPKLGQMQQF
ncbi:pyruvate kinase [Kipferlia bialata]|uniref:Pyruvate kinase n=1 Tax=Kipferlia bialata TaxID=797122 RepID=A0A391NMX7_9EUKA|nr:pyruvate kinase [Kipferlia bialata]|eukprot:g3289.t1